MNIFVLDSDPSTAATLLCDQHVGKMLLEACQLLCNAHEPTKQTTAYLVRTPLERLALGEVPYLPTHLGHPCSVWARAGLCNYLWLRKHALALAAEYAHRFDKEHGSRKVAIWAAQHLPATVTHGVWQTTPFAQAMPEQYRGLDAIEAYRRYYAAEKRILKGKPVTWTRRERPGWF